MVFPLKAFQEIWIQEFQFFIKRRQTHGKVILDELTLLLRIEVLCCFYFNLSLSYLSPVDLDFLWRKLMHGSLVEYNSLVFMLWANYVDFCISSFLVLVFLFHFLQHLLNWPYFLEIVHHCTYIWIFLLIIVIYCVLFSNSFQNKTA